MEYTLGWRGDSGKKADKGTIVHKVLELCALAKKALQDGYATFEDHEIGEIETANYDPEYLDEIIDRVYEYYTSRTTHHDWKPLDLKHCPPFLCQSKNPPRPPRGQAPSRRRSHPARKIQAKATTSRS